jgi:DNA-binding beta-propeller fold protein YncE
LDGIMYDEPDDKIILTNHSRPIGTLTALDPETGDIVATVELEDTAPEGAAADGKGHIFVNNESKHTIQVVDAKTWKATASWPLGPCEGPTGIAYDKASNRIFSGCNNTSVVVDANTGKRGGHNQKRHQGRCAGMGPVEETGVHSEWWAGKRHCGSPGRRGTNTP